jgi:hypothetical protein
VASSAQLIPCVLLALVAACGQSSGDQTSRQDTSARAARDSVLAPPRRHARVARPDSLRALYVNGWAAGSRSRMRRLIAIADSTEINAFVIDLKESDTFLTYDSTGIALAKEIGADGRPASRWMPDLVDSLVAHGIYPIARIVVFKDRMLAERRPDLAIRSLSGEVWLDNKGKPWVNPYHREVWDYNIAIAREALEMGFHEIQWDYVRFPDVTANMRRTMVYPGAGQKSRAENIHDFIVYSKQQLAAFGVPVTADVFGLVTHQADDVGIGQQWERVITAADRVLPMVYPSHYFGGVYGFQRPNAHPYELVRISMQDAVERTRHVREQGQPVGEVVPWLQAFTADYLHDGITYGAGHVRNQIQATYDAGLKSWVLWNPGSGYDVYLPALRPASGAPSPLERGGWRATRWEVPRNRMSMVIRRREAAARRDSVARDSASPAH